MLHNPDLEANNASEKDKVLEEPQNTRQTPHSSCMALTIISKLQSLRTNSSMDTGSNKLTADKAGK